MSYEMEKRKDGGWKAVTRVPLGFDDRWLFVETYKNYTGKLLTTALCAVVKDGMRTFVVGVGGRGDFYEQLAGVKTVATQRAVRMQHEDQLKLLPVLIAACKDYYQRRAA